MNNILVIALVLTGSLLLISLPGHHSEVIVKDGHRTVLVEYDKELDGTTKVSISPSPQDAASDNKKPAEGVFSGPRHKLVNALGKTKDMAAKTGHGFSDTVREIKVHAKEAVREAIEKSPQDLSEAKDKVSEGIMKKAVGGAKKLAENMMAVIKDGYAKDFDVIDSPKRSMEDISRNVTGKVHQGAEQVKKQAKEAVKNVQEVGHKSFSDILYKLKEVGYDVIWYVLYLDKIGSVIGLVHIIGFSTAYGMCVWVTFVSSYVLGRCLPRQMFGMVQSRVYPVYFRAMGCCVSVALLGHLVGHKRVFLRSKIGLLQSLSLGSALLMVLINMMLLEPKATKAMYKRMKLEKEEARGVGVASPAKVGMADGTTVRSTPNGKGVRVAVEDGMVANGTRDGMVDGVGATNVRPRGVGVAVEDGMVDGVGGSTNKRRAAGKDGMAVAGGGPVVMVMDRQDVLRLNERLKRLNAYSSALNLFTLVVLTWHMVYLGQRLQATR